MVRDTSIVIFCQPAGEDEYLPRSGDRFQRGTDSEAAARGYC